MQTRNVIWTIGHSTHSVEAFIRLLVSHGITRLVDIRRFPRSRRFPHFNKESLSQSLAEAGIGYFWLESLGGFRSIRAENAPVGWKSRVFAGYAAYRETPEFKAGLQMLEKIANEGRTAMMCAEGLWWRCHRRLVADALIPRGFAVIHILPSGKTSEHRVSDPVEL